MIEIHLRSTNGSIEYKIDRDLQIHSIPLTRQPIPELLAHLGLSDRHWTWQFDNSQGMNIALTVEERQERR